MNIYEHITQEHQEHRALLNKLENTSGDSEERAELFEKLKKDVTAHANAEEQTLYATLIAEPNIQEKARHSIHEHEQADDLFEELSNTDMSSAGWLVTFKKLKHELEHHMEEEENAVFAKARKVVSEDEAETLEKQFSERKEAELKAA